MFGKDQQSSAVREAPMTLPTSTPALEGVYQGSKYLKYQVLCEIAELEKLFIDPIQIYPLTGLSDGEPISSERFLTEYGSWIERLKQGEVPADADLRKVLAAAWTIDETALWKQPVAGGRYLIKMRRPVVQVQSHFFTYSSVDGVFRPMAMGAGSIFWGLQFSYPQIYQEPKTMEFLEADELPNARLFQKIKHWVREETRPTPFIVEGKRTNVPIRLGKTCFSWIHHHPQLKEQKISV